MAGNTDRRIVEIQFNNKQFEKNIAKSTKSVEELKEAMDFEETSKGLEKFAQSAKFLDFSGLENNIQRLTDKFTGLGNVGEYVISRIRNTIEGAARELESFIKGMSVDQIAVGQGKYDQMNKAVMTIVSSEKATEEQAYNVMSRIMTYTDQTSHDFNTMVGQLSNLTSIGMGLEEAERLLEGIGNAATFAGQGAQEAAASMGVLTKAFSAEYMSYERFLQLSQTSHVVTDKWRQQALEAAAAVGTLTKKEGKYYLNVKGAKKNTEVTQQNMDQMLKYKFLTSEALKELYKNYEFGDSLEDLKHPDEAIVAASEGLDTMKDEIGKKMKDLFPDSNVDFVKRKVREVGDDIETVATKTFTASADGHEGLKWNQDLIINITPITADGKKLTDKELDEYVENLLKISKNVKELKANDKKGKGLLIGTYTNFENFEKGLKKAKDDAVELHELQAEYYKDAKKANGVNTEFSRKAYLTGQRALTLADAFNAVKESVSSGWMETFRNIFGDVSEAAEHFTNIADRIIDFVEKIKTFRNSILSSWANEGGRSSLLRLFLGDYEDDLETGAYGLMDMLDGVANMIKQGFIDFLSLFADPVDRMMMRKNPQYLSAFLGKQLKSITDNIQNFFNSIRDYLDENVEINGKTKSRLEVIHEIVMGIAGAFKLAYDIMEGAGVGIGLVIQQLQPSIDKITGFFGDLGVSIYEMAQDSGDNNKILNFFAKLADTIKPITDGINSVIGGLDKFLRLIFGLDEETKTQGKTFETIGNFLLIIADIVAKVAGPVLEFIGKLLELITELFTGGISQDKIKEFGANLGTAFSTMMKSFADNLPESFGMLKGWIYDLFGLWEDESQGDSKSFFTFLRKLFTGGFANFGEFLSQLTSGFSLKNALETGFGFGAAFNFLNTVIGWFKGTNLYGVLMAFLGVASLGALWSVLRHVKKAIKTITVFFDDVGGNLAQGFTGEYEWFGERLLRIAKAIGILALAVFIFGSMDTGRLIQGVLGLAAVLGLMFGFIALLNTQKANMGQQLALEAMVIVMTASIVAIALAISVLALALIPLSLDPKRMITAVLGLAAILIIFGAFFKIMLDKLDTFAFTSGGTNQWAGIGKMAAMMFTLAGSVAILAAGISVLVVALTPLALTGWEGMLRAIIAFGAILTMVGAFMIIMLKQMDELAFTMGGGGKGAWSGVGKMAVMMLTLSASVALLAVGIGALVVAITPLALMSWEGFVRAMAGLGIIFIELGLMMKYLQKLNVGDKTASIKIAGLALFAISIGILVLALTPLALMPWGAWGRAMLGLGIVLAELVGFMWLVKKAGVDGVQLAGFIGFAFSIAVLMFALTPIAMLDWEQWARAMAGLAVVLLELIGFMKLAQLVKVDGVALGGFIGFALSIAILIFALKPLAEMSPQGYQQALIGLATVMLEIVILMAIMKEIKPDIKSSVSTILLLVGLGIAMVLFGVAMNEVKDIPWETMVGFAAAISLLMVAFGLTAKIVSAVGIKGILLAALGLAAMLGVISLLAPLLIGSVMGALRNAAGDFAIIADLMSTFSNKMSGVGEDGFDKAERLFTKMGELIGQLAGFMFNGWSTAQFMDAMARLVLSADELIKLDSKLKSLSDDGGATKAIGIVTLYEGLLEEHLSKFSGYTGYSNSFYTVMFNLGSAFDYFESMTKNMGSPEDNQGLQLIKQLAACASDLDTIYQMDLGKFRDQLAELGGAMIIYAQGAAAVEGKEITADTDIGGAIIVLQKISESLSQAGGFSIPSNMPKDDELTAFGVQLAALAGALVAFEQAGAGLGDGTEQALKTLEFFKDLKAQLLTMDLGKDLSESIDSLKGEDGVMIQADELTTFGEDIAKLGSAMSKFAESTQVVDEQTGEVKPIDFTKATEALDSIAGLNEKLPNLGGVLEAITGRKETLGELATQIEELGTAMGEFYTSTSTTDGKAPAPMDFSKSIEFLNSIGDLQTKLPTVKSFSLQSLFEDKQMTLGELASQLVQLGSGLGQLSERLSGKDESGNPLFDPATLTSAANVLTDSIVPFMNAVSTQLPHVGGLANVWNTLWNGRESTLSDIGTQLGGLGEGLGEFGQKITGKFPKDTSEITTAVSAIDSIIGLLMRLGDADNKLYAGSIADYAHNMNMFLQAFMNGTKIEGDENDFYSGLEAIVEIMQYVSDALNDTSGISVENLQMFELLTRALQNLASIDLTNTADFENVGLSIITGMANGITNNITIITVAAENAAIAAYNAAMAKLDANSPSKVFMNVGSYIGLGMAKGINDSTGDVVDAATGMSEGAIDSANNIVGIISRIMAEGSLDTQPTIAPVLDLTNLNTGMAAFGESLNGYSVGLDTSIAAARAAQAGATQYAEEVSGPDYSGIYERMSQLGEQISGMNKAVSQMRIYLDTGALVGGVSDQIDMDIGRKTFYASRNN